MVVGDDELMNQDSTKGLTQTHSSCHVAT